VINIIVDVVTTDASEGSANITFLAQFPTSRVPTTSQADNVVEVSPEDATPEEPATTVTASEWINVSLEAVDGDDADSKAELNVMAKRIAIAEAIAEKTAQLEKAVAEIAQIQNLLKEAQAAMVKEQKSAAASKASTATKKKASVTAAKRKVTMSKTAKKSAKSNSVADEDDDDDITDKQQAVQKKSSFEIPSLATVQTYVVNGGFMALNLTLAHRAVVFFGLAAAGVYAYGDYASV
jgi:isoleucyl-tRNA synthetase